MQSMLAKAKNPTSRLLALAEMLECISQLAVSKCGADLSLDDTAREGFCNLMHMLAQTTYDIVEEIDIQGAKLQKAGKGAGND